MKSLILLSFMLIGSAFAETLTVELPGQKGDQIRVTVTSVVTSSGCSNTERSLTTLYSRNLEAFIIGVPQRNDLLKVFLPEPGFECEAIVEHSSVAQFVVSKRHSSIRVIHHEIGKTTVTTENLK